MQKLLLHGVESLSLTLREYIFMRSLPILRSHAQKNLTIEESSVYCLAV